MRALMTKKLSTSPAKEEVVVVVVVKVEQFDEEREGCLSFFH